MLNENETGSVALMVLLVGICNFNYATKLQFSCMRDTYESACKMSIVSTLTRANASPIWHYIRSNIIV